MDGIAHCARNALVPTPSGHRLAANVAEWTGQGETGYILHQRCVGCENSAARAVRKPTASASMTLGKKPFRINVLARAALERQRPERAWRESWPEIRPAESSPRGLACPPLACMARAMRAQCARNAPPSQRNARDRGRVFSVFPELRRTAHGVRCGNAFQIKGLPRKFGRRKLAKRAQADIVGRFGTSSRGLARACLSLAHCAAMRCNATAIAPLYAAMSRNRP